MTLDLSNPQPLPGDGLRDEAANLLATRFGHPVREKLIAGKKVDLCFVHRDLGKVETIVVEAKDLDHNMGRSELAAIWADYDGVVREAAPATLLLITRRGLSSAGQAFVDGIPQMRHQTIWELENEMIGLTDYVRSLAEVFDREGLSAYYVPGQARFVTYSGDGEERNLSAAVVDAFEAVTAWIESEDYRPVAILGGYGAGKTSLAKKIIAAQAAKALENPLARRPILIPLSFVARYTGVEGLLAGMFTYDFPVRGFNVHHLLAVSDKGRLLVVLDGFDEMKHAMTWADFRSQVKSLNRLTQGRAKVLLLGRPSAFLSSDEHFHVLRGLKRLGDGWRRLEGWPEFKELDLAEFTPAERAEFVRGYLRYRMSLLPPGEAKDEVWIRARGDEVNRIADHDSDMFAKPVHAKILTDLAADPMVDLARFAGGVSRWDLYATFFESLAERETEKDARLPISERDRLNFLREVAFWLWSQKGGATDFHADDLPDRLIEGLPGEAADRETLKREYLTGSFLEKKSGDLFYFGHRSFAEFLVADRMVRRKPSPTEQATYSSLLRDGVAIFLKDAPRREAVQAWAETLSQAVGVLHFEYIEFVADSFGGPAELRRILPSGAPWLPILDAFGGEITFTEGMRDRLLAGLRTANVNDFFLLFSVLTFYAASPAFKPDPEGWSIAVAAVLLDRVFRTAEVDLDAGRAKIDPVDDPWRGIANRVLPELSQVAGARELVFRGPQLMRLMDENLRAARLEIGLQSPTARLSFGNEQHLPWAEVLAAMKPDTSKKAVQYFRRRESLAGVFSAAAVKHRPETPRSKRR